VDRFIVTAPAGTERAAEPERLVETLNRLQVDDVEVVDGVPNAIDHAISTSGEQDIVLVFGSFYTVTEARKHMEAK
jgi:folylpolyglutamate synthase/dihydropteroate synthase